MLKILSIYSKIATIISSSFLGAGLKHRIFHLTREMLWIIPIYRWYKKLPYLSSGCVQGWIIPFMSKYRLSNSTSLGLGLLVSIEALTPLHSFACESRWNNYFSTQLWKLQKQPSETLMYGHTGADYFRNSRKRQQQTTHKIITWSITLIVLKRFCFKTFIN